MLKPQNPAFISGRSIFNRPVEDEIGEWNSQSLQIMPLRFNSIKISKMELNNDTSLLPFGVTYSLLPVHFTATAQFHEALLPLRQIRFGKRFAEHFASGQPIVVFTVRVKFACTVYLFVGCLTDEFLMIVRPLMRHDTAPNVYFFIVLLRVISASHHDAALFVPG